jgi:ABC-2 type transport system ATP-binding protein
VDGVLSVSTHGRQATMQLRGSVEPLLQVLAASGVSELRSREPSLEELFLTLYGGGGGPRGSGDGDGDRATGDD